MLPSGFPSVYLPKRCVFPSPHGHVQIYVLGGTLPSATAEKVVTVDVIMPYAPVYTLFRNSNQMDYARAQFSALATAGTVIAVGGDDGGDTEDVVTCPPQFTGPDCNQPDAATCNYGYYRSAGACLPW